MLQLNYLTWDIGEWFEGDVEEMARLERYSYHRAVELQPDHPEVLARRGWEQFEIHHNWQEAARLIERAVIAAPANPRILQIAAGFARQLNRFDVSNGIRLRWLEMDPLCVYCMYGLMRGNYVGRNYGQALEWYEKAQELRVGGGGMTLTKIYLHRGELDLAMQAAERWNAQQGRDALIAMVLHSRGQESEALDLLATVDRSIARTGGEDVIAQAAAWMGQTEMVFEELDLAFGEEDYQHFFLVQNDPVYDSVRDDPRWRVLLEKVNLTPEQSAAIVFNPVLPN